MQNGNPIFVMICSFMRQADKSLQHQYRMPKAPPPSTLPCREEMLGDWLQQVPDRHHPAIKKLLEEVCTMLL
jgi:acyl-CoA thioesterase 8